MDVHIFGILGQPRAVIIPLEELEVEELEVGQEFIYAERSYEIRSIFRLEDAIQLNVMMTLDVSSSP